MTSKYIRSLALLLCAALLGCLLAACGGSASSPASSAAPASDSASSSGIREPAVFQREYKVSLRVRTVRFCLQKSSE